MSHRPLIRFAIPCIFITACAITSTVASPPDTAQPESPRSPTATRQTHATTSPTLAPPTLNGSGKTFYVATNGDDGNDGSMDRPWGTIQFAATKANAGDTVFARAGTYRESITLSRSGANGKPITFAAYQNEKVILDGFKSLDYGIQTQFQNPDSKASDIVINGFTIQNYTANAIALWSINNRWTLENLNLLDNGDFAILVSNSDGLKMRNVIMQNNVGGFSCSPILPPNGEGCTNLYIGDSKAIDNGKEDNTGVDAFAVENDDTILVERSLATGGPGDGFDFKSNRTTLSQVIAYNTRNNIKLWGKESKLINSLAYDAKADANLVLVAGGSYTVMNVTIANMIGTAYLVTIGDPSGSGATLVKIFNSIFYNDNPAMQGTLLWFGPSITLTADNNLYFNPHRTEDVICAEFKPFDGQCFSDDDINSKKWIEKNGKYVNPAFVNSVKKDFHLKKGSAAIDAGITQDAPDKDLESKPRTKPDIGAYEN